MFDKNNNITTVQKTVNLNLCVSCGVCKSACPNNSIELVFLNGQYVPKISDTCNYCGLCLDVCPGIEVNFEDLYSYEGKEIPSNYFEGHVINSYTCFTKDESIRKNSSSGGMVTSLIVELLQKNIYMGAFVLPFDGLNLGLAKHIFTQDVNQVLSASKSKYLPASVENIISTINNLESAIIVGTPCQIHGIKKYCLNKNINFANILFLGLFCDKTLNYNFLSYYKYKYGKNKYIVGFDYRNKEKGGWPGHTKLKFHDGDEKFVNRIVRINVKNYFQLNRCLYCVDKLNQLSDISFGDCYIQGNESKLGLSNIIVRTEKGKNALDLVKGNFCVENIDFSLIANSQKVGDKSINLAFCNLLYYDENHIIYPSLHEFTKGIQSEMFKQKYCHYLSMIDIGKNPKNFDKIDRTTKLKVLRNNVLDMMVSLSKKLK